MILGKKGMLEFAIWGIAFAISVFLTLIVPSHYSAGIITSLVFDVIAYIAVLILWISLIRKTKFPTDILYGTPVMVVSVVYLVIQMALGIVSGLLVDVISFKFTLILNIVLMVVVWFLILSTIIAKNYIQHIDSRQKDYHVKL